MSRIRQIKPSWFLDKDLRRGTTADAREFYIGLWMLADDAGYLAWDVERIGAELYPFDPITRRERNVEKWAAVLERLDPAEPHLIVWDCGHGRVPKMVKHQRIAGNQTFAVKAVHAGMEGVRGPDPGCVRARSRLSLQVATGPESLHVATGSPGRELVEVGNGTVRYGTVGSASAPAPDGGAARSTFDERMAANGVHPAIAGKAAS
jgi:hypothetical protein